MPYNIALPDGRVVTGIPDDVTPQQAKARLLEAYPEIAKMTAPAVGEFATPKPATPTTPTEKPEDQSFFRKVADVPLQFQKGFVSGIRLIADAFGADSSISKNLRGVEEHLAGLMSAQSKQDSAEMARIMKDAEDKGIGAQVVAGIKALSVAPIDTVVNALGTTAPTILAGIAGGLPVAGAVGATMGAGTVKSAVYEAVKEVLGDSKMSPKEIEARAVKAQEYLGGNLDMIATGAALGVLESVTGSQAAAKRITDKILARSVAKEAASEAAENAAQKTITGAIATGAAKEAAPEFLQGAQEQLARNIAQQREGFDVPTMRGVITQGTLEAGAGAMIGGVTGPIELAATQEKQAEIKQKIDALQNTPPPPGSDEERVLQVAAQIQARGNVDPQNAMIMAMNIVANENVQSEKIDGPKPPEATGNAPLFIFDTAEQAQERTELLKKNRPKENFAFQEMPNGKFGIYKVPVETTGVTNVAEPITGTTGVGAELSGEGGAGVPAGGVVAPVPAGLDATGAVTQQPDAGEAVQPAALEGAPSETITTAPAVTVPSATPSETLGEPTTAVSPTVAAALETPPAVTPTEIVEEEPSVTEAPEAVETEEEGQAEPPAAAAPESTEVIAAIDELNAATEEAAAAVQAREENKATRQKGQGEPAALRRAQRDADEKIETAIVGSTGTGGMLGILKDLQLKIANAEQTLRINLARTADPTKPEDVASDEAVKPIEDALLKNRAELDLGLTNLFEFANNPQFEGRPSHTAAVQFLTSLDEATKDRIYARAKRRGLLEFEQKGGSPTVLESLEQQKKERAIDRADKQRDEELRARAEGEVTETKTTPAPVVTAKKKRRVEIPAASKAVSQQEGSAATEVKAGGTVEEQKVQSELTDKSMLEVVSWAVDNAPNKFAKYIAERVRDRLNAMAARGVQLDFKVMGGQQRLTSLFGAKGICTTDWSNNKVSVSLNGVPVVDNQNGYPSGMNYVTVLHELIHAATVAQNHFLPANSPLRKELNNIFNAVVTHFNTEVKAGRMTPFMERIYNRNVNALRNPDELIAWGLTDADMQEFLSSVKVGEKTAMQQFVEWIRQVLNINPEYESALDRLVQTTDALLTKSVEEIAADVETSGKFKYGSKTSAQEDNRVVIPPVAQQRRARKSVATSLKTDPTFNQFNKKPITEALAHIAATGNPFERALATRLLARDNRAGVKDTKMYVLDEEGVEGLKGSEADMTGANGLYYLGAKGDAIFLLGDQFEENGINNQTVLHEALHATVNKRIIYGLYAREMGLPVNENLERTVADLNELLERADTALDQFLADNKDIPESIQNLIDGGAFDTVTEFVAYGMTDPAMQKFLRDNVGGVVTKTNGLADFVRLILDMMGLGPEHVSGLRDLIEYTNRLAASIDVDPKTARAVLDVSKENRVLDIQATSKAAKRKEATAAEIQQKVETSADADQMLEEIGSLSNVAKNPKLWGEYLQAKFTDINVGGMNVLLSAMPTGMVVDIGKSRGITRLGDVDTDVREAATMRTRILNRVQEISTPWIKLSPPIQKQLGKVMAQATLAQIDPAKEKGKDKTLDDMYKALTPDAKAVYENVRDFYEDQYNLYKALLQRAAERMGGKEGAPETLGAIKALYEVAKNKGPYFPLMRYGKFYARFGKGANKEFYMFESAGLRDAFVARKMAELTKKGEKRTFNEMMETDDADRGNDVEGMRKELLKDNMQLQNIFKMIDQSSGLGDEKVRAVLKDQIYQMHLMGMPEASMRKHFIHRNGVTGFSGDALRNFLNSGTRMASQIARVRYNTDITNNMAAAKESLKGNPEKDKLEAIVKEVEARVNDELNPPVDDTLWEALARKTNKVAFLYMLTSAKSAFNQMFSVLNFTVPTLAARHGWIPTMKEMSKYLALGYGQMGTVKKNIDGSTSWVAPTIALSEGVAKNPDEQYAVQRMQDMGISDATRTYDLFLRRDQASADYNSRFNKITNMMGALFHHSERISREITFMSSFRLAKAKGMTREQAVEQAVNDTNTALFDYSAWNRPRVLRPPAIRVIAQFKQFPLYVTLYLARNGHQLIKSGATPQERKEAATMLFGTLGITALMAGASGSFGYSVIMGAIQGIRNALRDDDEEDPLEEMDFEQWFRNVFLPETFGDTKIMGMKLSELIDSGLLNTATGLDVASGVSLNNLWFHDTPEANRWKDKYENLLISLMGPGISVGKQVMAGIDDLNNGEFLKGTEKLLPAFFRGTATAIRYDQEGAKSTIGAEIKAKEDFTMAQLVAQAMGFRTTGLSQIMNNNFAIQQMVNKLNGERGGLLKKLDIAVESGNDDNVDSILDDIDAFSARYPTYAIKPKEIASSLKAREKARAQSEAGLYLNKRATDFGVLRDRALENLERETTK